MNKASHENDQFNFVYQSGQRLNQVDNQKNNNLLTKLRKKWTGAAIVALASSSVLLFSTHNVKAAEQSKDNTQPDPVIQENKQDTSKSLQAVERKDDVNSNNQSSNAQQIQVQNSESNQQKEDTSQTASQAESSKSSQSNQNQQSQQTTQDAQTADQSGQKDAQGVELPANNQDHIKGNVQSAWDQGYKGEHIVVAVIDSGVDVNHKDFLNMPKNPKLTANQMKELIKKLGHGRYVNEKFPYVYNAVDNENDHMKAPDSEPHGQHVSGIIAADGHPDGDKEYVVGVAPEAQLMHFKVFGDNSTSLDMAQEIYDAVNLGADVINMSLGGGVSPADINIQDQRAVQYAIDHGVIVSISASNNGNAASVDNPTHLTDTDDYRAGGNAGNYEPFSSSTVANPGASRGAITVAAETSGLGENSDMAAFSSWGPLPDFTLKPDVSAPGSDVISTANDNGYTTMSGTSMASPFTAGAAALVKERLLKTNPELKGAELVAAVKALLMNTANPQIQNGYTTIVSPRRQGAGQINVGSATKSPVYITTADGTGALSLRKVENSTNFVLTFHNLSNKDVSYSFDDYGGGYTELRDKDNGVFHDVQLAGARVNGDNVVTLKPNETKEVTYTLNLTNLKSNQLVEGYLNFTNSEDKSTLVVPYLAYYGDMTKENVFDQNANDPKPDIQGDRLVNEDNYPRGIADEQSLKELVNIEGNYNWQEVAKLYESGKVAFSPNGDNKSDLIKPYAYLKQNISDLKVEILDGNGKVVRVLADSHGVEKSYHSDGDGATVDLGYGATNSDAFTWDGKLYDTKTGKMIAAPDGNYTYRFVATLVNDGPQKVQTNDTPVIIDTTAPVVNDVHYNRRTHTLSGNYVDGGAGFTNYSYATVTVNDKVFGFKLNDGDNSGFDDADKTKGHFSFELNAEQLEALSSADNLISLALSDVADNTTVKTIKVEGAEDVPGISIWNATNGLAFNEESPDYDDKNNTFNLRGSATDDFFVNGKWVQIDNDGQFVLPVSAEGEQTLVFTSDDAGKDVLKTFTNFTPKAKFAWQHVDGKDKHFGPAVYSIFGNNPDDIVVQAAVTKGDNVKAFAKDYFTGQIYTGEVKDGVATFHVKTSINKDPSTGIFARALLQGWTEIDGPTFNDKQKTDPTAINDANYIGVYYDKNAKSKVYTDRSQLGVDMNDEAANTDDFGPGYYPPYSAPTDGNPDIHFDYLDDNNTASVGVEAVENGYYDPATQEFTLTGHVDDNVISLAFLSDSPYEEAPENQADISDHGKFKVSFRIPPTGTRSLSYLYMTNDGKVTRGSLTLILDTVLPTLDVDQIPSDQDTYEVTTNKPTFKLSGVVNDNLDSYALTINGDNVFTQYGNSGYDFIPGLYDDPNQKTPNTYGPYNFSVDERLDDNNGQPSTHVFKLSAVDAVGNKTEKKVIVHYDPNYGKKPEENQKGNSNDQNTSGSVNPSQNKPAESQTKDNSSEANQTGSLQDHSEKSQGSIGSSEGKIDEQKPSKPEKNDLLDPKQKSENSSNSELGVVSTVSSESNFGENNQPANSVSQLDNESKAPDVSSNSNVTKSTLKTRRIKLYHNAFVYKLNGDVIKKNGKPILYKKGHYFVVESPVRVVKINGKKFYQVGKNRYVKVNNTLKRRLVRLVNIYNKNGKKVGQLKISKNLKLFKNAKIYLLRGEKYYKIAKNKYVKVSDIKTK